MNNMEQKDKLRRELTNSLMQEFCRHLLVYTICLIVAFVIAYKFCAQRTWYGTESIYPLIHFAHEHWFAGFMFCELIGSHLLATVSFRKSVHLMETILAAVNHIYRQQGELLELPEELHEVEKELNQVMLDVEASRQKVSEAEQRKNDLIVYMAHDLKTPLTSVIGYLSLLQDERNISPELQEKYIDIARRKSERLEDLINEFFDITRFSLSTMVLELSTVHITRMIEQMAFEFTPMFQEKNLTYVLDLEPNLELLCDVDKLQRVFDNLLRNAVNYSYESTQICICAKTIEEDVQSLPSWDQVTLQQRDI